MKCDSGCLDGGDGEEEVHEVLDPFRGGDDEANDESYDGERGDGGIHGVW